MFSYFDFPGAIPKAREDREVDKHRKGEAASKDEVEEEEIGRGSVVDETISLADRPIEGKSGEENMCIPLF